MSDSLIPLKKRAVESESGEKISVPADDKVTGTNATTTGVSQGSKKRTPEQSRALRLAQNRKAARESRRRKKALVEELQRSLVFFSRTNASLKQQNDDLTRRLLESHSILAKMGEPVPSLIQSADTNGTPQPMESSPLPPPVVVKEPVVVMKEEEAPTAAPAETCPIKPKPATLPLPAMQPGATMQAMADFQQAAAAAMQAAEEGMKATIGAAGSEVPTGNAVPEVEAPMAMI